MFSNFSGEFQLTIHLSTVVAGARSFHGDASEIRHFRHTDFSRSISPVVSVNHFDMTEPTFNPESYAAKAVATLLLEDSTSVTQRLDGTARKTELRAGDLHWTLGGRGIAHAQRSTPEARLHGLQIFIDMPSRLKPPPQSSGLLRASEMPVIQSHSGRMRIVSGSFAGLESPIQLPEPLLILDTWLHPGATTSVPLPPGWNAWITTLQGKLGVRARHECDDVAPLPKVAGGDLDFAVISDGSAVAASATPCGREGVLLLMAGKVPVHFVLVAGPAVVAVPEPGIGAAQAADAVLAEALTAC